MSRITGALTVTGTGIKTFNLGFQPTWIRFVVCSRTSAQTYSHMSIGETDGTTQLVASTFQDGSGGKSVNSLSKVVSHYERVSGAITEVLAASFDSFTATGFKLNVAIGNPNYQVFITAGT